MEVVLVLIQTRGLQRFLNLGISNLYAGIENVPVLKKEKKIGETFKNESFLSVNVKK